VEDFGGLSCDGSFPRQGSRDQLRRQGDQEDQLAREVNSPLENIKIAWDDGCGKGGR